MDTSRVQPISETERSGVLKPVNLERFAARWITPAVDVSSVVDVYWSVRWQFGPGESVEQQIIDHPAITLTVENGRLMASSARVHAWSRTISGAGDVFAVRLRPAGLAVLSDLDPRTIAEETEITPGVDARCYRFLAHLAAAPDTDSRTALADSLVRTHLAERPLRRAQLLANDAVDLITAHPHVQRVGDVAAAVGVTPRTLQRALMAGLGRGPVETARRVRLQEVVRRLSLGMGTISVIAAISVTSIRPTSQTTFVT